MLEETPQNWMDKYFEKYNWKDYLEHEEIVDFYNRYKLKQYFEPNFLTNFFCKNEEHCRRIIEKAISNWEIIKDCNNTERKKLYCSIMKQGDLLNTNNIVQEILSNRGTY